MAQMNVGLVANAVLSSGRLVPSGLMLEGSLGQLASSLYHAGYIPKAFDFNNTHSLNILFRHGKDQYIEYIKETLDDYISTTKAKILGFTLYSNGFVDNAEIASYIKNKHNVLIVAGGPIASWCTKEVLEYRAMDGSRPFDIVGFGKGYKTIVDMANFAYGKAPLTSIENAFHLDSAGKIIGSHNSRSVNTSSIKPPMYDADVYPFFKYKIPISTLTTSVGCWNASCAFCIQPLIDGKFIQRPLDDVIADFEFQSSNYGVRYFRLSDPNPPSRRLTEISKISSKARFASFAYASKDLDVTKLNNFVSIFTGIEALDIDSLKRIAKTSDPENYLKAAWKFFDDARKTGIATVCTSIAPLACDTAERIQRQVESVKLLNPDFITATPLSPIPGTPLYHNIKNNFEQGVILEENYEKKLLLWELDLLAAPKDWQKPPWKIMYNSEFTSDPMSITATLVSPLAKSGIGVASDEIVLMAHMYNSGLDKDQNVRRGQVMDFQKMLREIILHKDVKALDGLMSRMR